MPFGLHNAPMARRKKTTPFWSQVLRRSLDMLAKQARQGARQVSAGLQASAREQRAAQGVGQWLPGLAISPHGLRRYHLYKPRGTQPKQALPLLVMLHGCGQDAQGFAALTRMNRLAERHRFLVLYPEQDRLANPQRCWNWFEARNGRAEGEAASILAAIDQVCLQHPVDVQRLAVAGLSAGASMAALLALRNPARFKAVVMHSGVAPGAANSPLSALQAMRGRRRGAAAIDPNAAATAPLPALLVIQGNQDHTVDASNGPAAAHRWVAGTGAQAAPVRVLQRGQRHPMVVTDFKLGRRVLATWIQVQGLGHAWSGGAAREPFSDPRGPDASRLIWAYVARHFAA